MIDLRSDTITKPTPAMREFMMKAEVGDDVMEEDPSINALQEKAAGLLGREAALFVPSGTMANTLAIKVLTHPGDEIILADGSHPFMFEGAAPSIICAVQTRVLPAPRGLLEPDQILPAIRPHDIHHPPTSLITLENTHNRGGGTVYPLATVAAIREVADRHSLSVHMDGARLLNACAATGHKPAEYARYAHTVCFCLSKGLGAPVGSLLVGDRATISQARRWRKMLGGGMRQAGFLAAAGIYALDHHVERLSEDHNLAKTLARGLARMDGLELDPEAVETNIVIFSINRQELTAATLADRLKNHGILVQVIGHRQIRAVTHLDVDRDDIDLTIK
ncbi:MAG: low-specificity L-threonine aldolase, partial [Deltaproteobacteria bacterium]|nr:low-specificity L-threonine aldolase [Deltaproteobacteria bacterium]